MVCVKCKATSSLLWQKNQIGALLCRDCYSQERRTRSSRSPQRIASTTTASTSTTETTNSMTSSSCATTTNQQAQSQSSEKSSTSKYQTSSVSTRRTTRSRERNNRAKQQQQQQQKEVQQVQNVASASMSTPPSPATSTNGVSVKEKVNSKPLSNGTHDRDTSNGEDGQQKGRRSLKLKQGQPTKAPSPEVMIVTSDSIIHKVNLQLWHDFKAVS